MFNFNNTHIFTGFLKQLLHEFNLPKFKVYTKEQADYKAKYGKELNIIGTKPRNNDKFDDPAKGYTASYPDLMKYIPYIRNNMIQEYIDGKWVDVGSYIENNKVVIGKTDNKYDFGNTPDQISMQHNTFYNYGLNYQNYTKNLRIENNIYDSYTHEYLGDYLRFQRDYNNLDLMSLYNCFSNRVCDKINLKAKKINITTNWDLVGTDNWTTDTDFSVYYAYRGSGDKIKLSELYDAHLLLDANLTTEELEAKKELIEVIKRDTQIFDTDTKLNICIKTLTQENPTKEFIFSTQDTHYKIYMLPVKLFKSYTIAIDSELPIELCCVMYGNYYDDRAKFNNSLKIAGLTYQKIAHTKFHSPFIYDKINILTSEVISDNNKAELYQNEEDLKLLLKVPVTNTSSIVILEGDYRNWNDTIVKSNGMNNHTIVNIENISKYEQPKLISRLQLLKMNTKQQIPFADRLVEYLVENVITGQETIGDNIERAQTIMLVQHQKEAGFITTPQTKWMAGLWTDQMRILAYEFIQNYYNTNDINHDILGYIDKDVEQKFISQNNLGKNVSISNVDIYQEEQLIRRIYNGKY